MCRSKKSSRTATCGKFCVLVRVHQNLNLEEINLSLVSLGAQGHLNKTKRFTFEDLIHLITLSTTFQNNRQVCVDLFIYKILIMFISSFFSNIIKINFSKSRNVSRETSKLFNNEYLLKIFSSIKLYA